MADVQRVCILADAELRQHQVAALERLVSETGVEIPLVVAESGGDAGSDQGGEDLRSLVRKLRDEFDRKGWWALVSVERFLAERLGFHSRYWGYQESVEHEDVDVFDDARIVRCDPIPVDGGPWNELPADVIDAVAADCDVCIRFGFGLITGRILDAPPEGVLSVHPADIREIRGLGPEIAYAEQRPSLGITIQRLNDDIDAGDIVAYAEANIGTARTYDEVMARMLEEQIPLYAEAIENLRASETTVVPPGDLGEYYPLRTRERFGFAAQVAARTFVGRLRDAALG